MQQVDAPLQLLPRRRRSEQVG